MSVAPVVFVDIQSSNFSSMTWPSLSTPMFYQDNESLLGSNQAFLTTNMTSEVLVSITETGFFGKGTPAIPYSRAWQSVMNSQTGTFTMQSVPLTTTLGSLSFYNSRSQLFASTQESIAAFQEPWSFGQFIVNVLNGPSNVPTNSQYPSFTCPCQNADSSNAQCSVGAWNFLAQQINLTLTNKVSSYMAPCMNPGNTMIVNEGVGSLFNVSAQIKRIRNLDRIRFRAVSATPKPCNNSILYQFAAVTCGETERDECPSKPLSCTSPINTRLGLDFSIQATVLGTNVLDSSRLCDNLDPIGAMEHCPLQAGQCLEVFLPLMLVNMTLEVPLSYTSNTIYDDYCKLYNSSNSAFIGKFENASFSMGLAMSEKPIILYPTQTVLIPPQYKTFIETAVMDAANTVLKGSLDSQITNAFTPFFQNAFKLAPLMDVIPICANFSQSVLQMACPSSEFIVPPVTCDPCDFCCICYTGGDCGEKCLQRCPCVNSFCTAVDRIIYPIWWKIVIVIFILVVFVMFAMGGFMRGIQR